MGESNEIIHRLANGIIPPLKSRRRSADCRGVRVALRGKTLAGRLIRCPLNKAVPSIYFHPWYSPIGLRLYKPYTGPHPDTGEKVEVPASFAMSLKMDGVMAQYLNSGSTSLELSPIVLKDATSSEDVQALIECFADARAKLIRGERVEIPNAFSLEIREKEGGREVIAVEESPGFKQELNRRLSFPISS